MAPRSALAVLPPEIKQEFERRLTENGFQNYTDLTEWLNEQGFQISRSAVHRYGQKIERRFAAFVSVKSNSKSMRFVS